MTGISTARPDMHCRLPDCQQSTTVRLRGDSTHYYNDLLEVWNSTPLNVVSQEVVDIDTESADGRHLVQAGMGTMPVVLVSPGLELSSSFR
jgi:hypothetical protein